MSNLTSEVLSKSDLAQVDPAPNWAYLDSYKVLHVWHKKHENPLRNGKVPMCIEVQLPCFGGYAVIDGKQLSAEINDDDTITAGNELLIPIVKTLAQMEGYNVK